MPFLDNLKTITQEGNMETRQMTPFFSSTFSALTVCNIHFLFENSQNLFWCGPPFGPFWSVKYLNFGQKLPIQPTHHTFLESRHPDVTKNPYYVLSPEWSQKTVSAHGLKSSRNNYDGNKKQSHTSGKPKNDNVKNKSNADSKTKIMLIRWLNLYDGKNCFLKRTI